MMLAQIRLLGLVKFTWNSRVELNSLPQVGRSCEIMSAHSSLIALEVIDSQLSLQSALCCSQSTLFNLTFFPEDEQFARIHNIRLVKDHPCIDQDLGFSDDGFQYSKTPE